MAQSKKKFAATAAQSDRLEDLSVARAKPNGTAAKRRSAPSVAKAGDDDFVMTISDSDTDVPDLDEEEEEEEEEDAGNSSGVQVKTEEEDQEQEEEKAVQKSVKRGKKRKRAEKDAGKARENGDRDWAGEEKGEEKGKRKKREGDDGALDPDFEFQVGDLGQGVGEFEGWGFEGAEAAMKESRKGVDIDEIIRRRKGAQVEDEEDDEDDEEEDGEGEGGSGAEDSDSEDNEEGAMEFLGFDEDDEDVAEDGFGMGADSDEEDGEANGAAHDSDSDNENNEEKDEYKDSASDSDSVASQVPHPDDDASSASDAEDNAEEAARKAAFFAPASEGESTAQTRGTTTFQQMNLSRPILRGLANVGFTVPTQIQQKTIPVALLGKDVVGGAVTGSGKTAAFLVPILERLLYRPKKLPTSRVLVLCPTRELAMQAHSVAVKLAAFTDITFALAVGGLSLKVQEAELKRRPDVIIATPGRFIDHMRNSTGFGVDTIEIIVMDEADRMLEDGFADELNEIINTVPKSRQTMLFSATMTDSVDKLIRLSLQRPVRLMVDAKKSTVKTLVQEFVRIRPQREGLRLAMLLLMCKETFHQRVIIFFRSKAFAHRARVVFGLFGLKAAELHGSLTQEQRIKSVESFRDGKVDFLLATDLASRGLDIKGVDVVINYEAPQSHEIYLHRVGRTARAGRRGRAVTLAAEADRKVVKAAIKAARDQSARVVARALDNEQVDAVGARIEALQDEVEAILREEKAEKELLSLEMQVRRSENLVRHEDEIRSRPKRTWFETQREKELRQSSSKAELNGGAVVVLPPKREMSSGKKRKREEAREARDTGGYKKTKADRMAKPAKGAKKKAAPPKGAKGKPRGAKGGKGKGRR